MCTAESDIYLNKVCHSRRPLCVATLPVWQSPLCYSFANMRMNCHKTTDMHVRRVLNKICGSATREQCATQSINNWAGNGQHENDQQALRYWYNMGALRACWHTGLDCLVAGRVTLMVLGPVSVHFQLWENADIFNSRAHYWESHHGCTLQYIVAYSLRSLTLILCRYDNHFRNLNDNHFRNLSV